MNGVKVLIGCGVALFAWSLGRIIQPYGTVFLQRHAVLGNNYRGEPVPTGYGLVMIFTLAAVYVWLAPFYLTAAFRVGDGDLFIATGTASLWIVFIGWLDDTLTEYEGKGFRGHFALFIREGSVSTGLLKAIGGGAAAFAVAFVTADGVIQWAVHGLLIALTTNWLNLLDLRPGRAVKFYLFIALILIAIAWADPYLFMFLPLTALAMATLPADLSGRLMLGDSGANLLGMQLGIFAAVVLPIAASVCIVFLLLLGHVYAERHSLTELIARISWLRHLDRWGREET